MNNKFSFFAIAFALTSIIWCIILNIRLAEIYKTAGGKTQALFGIIEMSRIGYKIWVFVAGLIGLALNIVAIKKKETKKLYKFSLVLSLIALTLVFIRFWRWMI